MGCPVACDACSPQSSAKALLHQGQHLAEVPVDKIRNMLSCKFSCESKVAAQDYLKMNTFSEHIFEDANDLTDLVATTVGDGKLELVTSGEINSSGVTCTTRSKLNSTRMHQKECYANMVGASGEDFYTNLKFQDANGQLFTLDENVPWPGASPVTRFRYSLLCILLVAPQWCVYVFLGRPPQLTYAMLQKFLFV